MSGFLTPDPRLRELSDLGLILPGAKLHTYVAGTPATPLATYNDLALTIPNTNPVVASTGGLFGPVYLTPSTAYKFVLTDADDVTVWTQDNITVEGLGIASLMNHGVILGSGGSTLGVTAVGATGTALAGNTAADPTFQSLPTILGTQAANLILAGPVSGAAALVTMRALVAADVPAAIGGSLLLLKANSGTDTSAGATNVDMVAISGLTAKDALIVRVVAKSATQATAGLQLYSSTDSVQLANLNASVGADITHYSLSDVSQSQASATSYDALSQGKDSAPTVVNTLTVAAMATAWTGAWTLALRHTGVTAGGTLQWRWSIYKVAGQ